MYDYEELMVSFFTSLNDIDDFQKYVERLLSEETNQIVSEVYKMAEQMQSLIDLYNAPVSDASAMITCAEDIVSHQTGVEKSEMNNGKDLWPTMSLDLHQSGLRVAQNALADETIDFSKARFDNMGGIYLEE